MLSSASGYQQESGSTSIHTANAELGGCAHCRTSIQNAPQRSISAAGAAVVGARTKPYPHLPSMVLGSGVQ